MIKKLRIRNYQSHAKTDLEFHPNVNIIVGENQSGKTAIFRALNWLCFNRPAGGRMLHDGCGGAGHTTVEAEFSDGNIVKLAKKIKENKDGKKEVKSSQYELNNESFSGFSQSVPDRVRDAINLGELNIQKQLDKPFLITDSPGEVARTINRITNLDKSDEYIKRTSAKIRQYKNWKEAEEENLEEVKANLSAFDGIERLGDLETEIKQLDKSIDLLNDDIEYGIDLLADIADIDKQLGAKAIVDVLLDNIEEILLIDEKRVGLIDSKNEILDFVDICQQIRIHEQYLEIFALGDGIETANDTIAELNMQLGDLHKYCDAVVAYGQAKESYEAIKHQFLESVAENGVCPFCNSVIDSDEALHYLEGAI